MVAAPGTGSNTRWLFAMSILSVSGACCCCTGDKALVLLVGFGEARHDWSKRIMFWLYQGHLQPIDPLDVRAPGGIMVALGCVVFLLSWANKGELGQELCQLKKRVCPRPPAPKKTTYFKQCYSSKKFGRAVLLFPGLRRIHPQSRMYVAINVMHMLNWTELKCSVDYTDGVCANVLVRLNFLQMNCACYGKCFYLWCLSIVFNQLHVLSFFMTKLFMLYFMYIQSQQNVYF